MLISLIYLAKLFCNYIVVNNDKTVSSRKQLDNWLLTTHLVD